MKNLPIFALLLGFMLFGRVGYSKELTSKETRNSSFTSNDIVMDWYVDGISMPGKDTSVNRQNVQGFDEPIIINETRESQSSTGIQSGSMQPMAAGASTAGTLTNNLISIWELNETTGSVASDANGSNNGTITGCSLNQSSVANLSSSYGFDGNDRVTVNGAAGAGYSNGVTISLWVKPTNASYTYDGKIFDMGSSSSNRITLAMKSNLRLNFGVGQVNYAGYTTLTSSNWSHIVLVWDKSATNLKIYKNNSLMYNGTAGNPSISNYANIGNEYNNGASRYFRGGLDQVAIWNRPISAEEVTSLYNSGSGLAFSNWTGSSSSGGTVTSVGIVGSDFNITNSPVTTSGTINLGIKNSVVGANELASTGVVAGSYTNANLTVDSDGRITSASNGAAAGASSPWLGVSGTNDIYYSTGNVGIGTSNTGGYKLAVKGKIKAEEVVVATTGWADFVFEPNYQLKTLQEVEQFIKTNGHLPDIPTEAEVKENGVSVGEINASLLQKIEELTLYVIQQQKEILELKVSLEKNQK